MAADKRQHKVGLKARESGGKQDVKSFRQTEQNFPNEIPPLGFVQCLSSELWAGLV